MADELTASVDQKIHTRARRAAQDPVGLPPRPLPGIDPRWSRVVTAPDAEGLTRRWHVLDNGPVLHERGEAVRHTLLCVHGNPTWSYLWRRVLDQAPAGWRVVAVDHLGMGWSERPGEPRTLGQRIEDLVHLTDTLEITGPVSTLAHDWGGAISLGWAQRHTDRLEAVVLTNTAVHQPANSAPPSLIRLARSTALLERVCVSTPVFVRATTALSVPPLPREVRRAFASPYASPARRVAVGEFVQDIPLEPDHPSRAILDAVAAGCERLQDVPALMVWGSRDPIFGQRYLEDLLRRLPHADVQRYTDASHLVLEDRPDAVGVVWTWLQEKVSRPRPSPGPRQTQAAVTPVPIRVDTTRPQELAVAELVGGTSRRITFGELAERVDDVARGLAARGVEAGDRVAVLVPPGIELTALVYAVWRLGAVVVVADAGLGLGRLGAALRSAGPRHVVGIRAALALAALSRVPGQRLRVEPDGDQVQELAGQGRSSGVNLPDPATIDGGRDGAVLFTSGATGPPKGVVYTRDRLGAQVGLLRDGFGFGPGERFVAAFAPFALYGPALGLTSVVPDMDVTAPHTLTAAALAEAVRTVDATMVFAAPAALRNVVATADELDAGQRAVLSGPRLVLSAGAPVPVGLLHRVKELLPAARTQTPYGMTEALPVAAHDPTLMDPQELAAQAGVCVGPPLPGVEVRIAPLDGAGTPAEHLVDDPGTVGEIVVRGAHVKDRYDRAWVAQRGSERPQGWHRTGDVGHLDDRGRLWVEGRLAHLVVTPEGPVTPYAVEDQVRDRVPGLADAAVVGVGPPGAQQVVVVVVPEERLGPLGRARGARAGASALAGTELAAAVRSATSVPVAAVLVRDWLPVDVRHASKVDRTAMADWADTVLHGRRTMDRVRGTVRGSAPRRRSR